VKIEAWLETAYSEGRISITEAINVQRSANPDWRVLLGDKKFHYLRARQIIAFSLEHRLPLAEATAEIERPKKPKKQVSARLPKPLTREPKRARKKKKIRRPKALNPPKRGGKVQNVWDQFQQTGYAWRRYRS